MNRPEAATSKAPWLLIPCLSTFNALVAHSGAYFAVANYAANPTVPGMYSGVVGAAGFAAFMSACSVAVWVVYFYRYIDARLAARADQPGA